MLAMPDPLDWDPDPQAASLPSAHRIKAAGFAGLQTGSLFYPHLFFLLFGEDRFLSSCTEGTKECAIIAACNRPLQFPIRVLINSRTKSLQTSSASWCKQQAAWPCQLKPTACKLNPVARCQLHSFQRGPRHYQPANRAPGTDPAAQNHLARPLLIKGTEPDSTQLPACFFCVPHQT